MEINLRLRHAIYNVVANGGKPLSLAQAMRNAGYSESYARNPQKIKQTKLWEQETEDLFDKETLCKSLKSLLEARKLEFKAFPSSLGKEAVEELLTSIDCVVTKLQVGSKVIRVWYWSPDNRIRSQAIDMILRIHGEYKFPKPPDNPLTKFTDKQLIDEIKSLTKSNKKYTFHTTPSKG